MEADGAGLGNRRDLREGTAYLQSSAVDFGDAQLVNHVLNADGVDFNKTKTVSWVRSRPIQDFD